jgi:hypothetical protein
MSVLPHLFEIQHWNNRKDISWSHSNVSLCLGKNSLELAAYCSKPVFLITYVYCKSLERFASVNTEWDNLKVISNTSVFRWDFTNSKSRKYLERHATVSLIDITWTTNIERGRNKTFTSTARFSCKRMQENTDMVICLSENVLKRCWVTDWCSGRCCLNWRVLRNGTHAMQLLLSCGGSLWTKFVWRVLSSAI